MQMSLLQQQAFTHPSGVIDHPSDSEGVLDHPSDTEGVLDNPSDSEGKNENKRQKCLFYESGTEKGVLHEVSTFDADQNIRTMIKELNDTTLMTRVVGGDFNGNGGKIQFTMPSEFEKSPQKSNSEVRPVFRKHERTND